MLPLSAGAATTQPWWGGPLFALGGALLGALLAQAFNVYNSRRRAHEERDKEDQRQRRETLVELLASGHQELAQAAHNGGLSAEFYSAYQRAGLVLHGESGNLVRAYYEALHELAGRAAASDEEGRQRLAAQYATAERRLVESARSNSRAYGLPGPVEGPEGRVTPP